MLLSMIWACHACHLKMVDDGWFTCFFMSKCITLGFMLVIFFFVIGIVPVIFFNGTGGVVIRTLIFFSVLFFLIVWHWHV